MATEPNAPPPRRNLLVETTGLAVSMAAGAYLAIHPDGNGWGYPAFVVLCALLSGVVWVRRNEPLLQTAGILLVMFIVGLMICGSLRSLAP